MSAGKNIVLGVTGSIAAYKAADLTSRLTKQGAGVNVVMTADALRFITPLVFKTLSRHPVVSDLYDEEEGWKPTHIRLADEADLLLVAPATANNIAKLAHGIADDALTCIALALNPRAKVLMAPALNVVLMTGDRISRIVQPEDYDYYPVRPLGEWQPRPIDMTPHPGDGL